jgi:hypothetical protein
MTEHKNKKAKKPVNPDKKPHGSLGRRHSDLVKAKISEKRRARTVQPRNISQSNKRTSFYHELEHDWQGMISKKNSELRNNKIKEALEWIESNKEELGYIPKEKLNNREMVLEQYDKYGILTEYLEMYNSNYEERIPDVLFNDERAPINVRINDPWEMIDNFSDSDSDFSNIYAEIFEDNGEFNG